MAKSLQKKRKKWDSEGERRKKREIWGKKKGDAGGRKAGEMEGQKRTLISPVCERELPWNILTCRLFMLSVYLYYVNSFLQNTLKVIHFINKHILISHIV